jgi:hypothetical protein
MSLDTREQVLSVRPWAVFFPGDPPPGEHVVLYKTSSAEIERKRPQSKENGQYFVAVGIDPENGWWLCHMVESPEKPQCRLYRVDPTAKTRLKLHPDAQYTMAEAPPVRPGSWFYTQAEYHRPVRFSMYPPEFVPAVTPGLNEEKQKCPPGN